MRVSDGRQEPEVSENLGIACETLATRWGHGCHCAMDEDKVRLQEVTPKARSANRCTE